jgi:hypothetical protein
MDPESGKPAKLRPGKTGDTGDAPQPLPEICLVETQTHATQFGMKLKKMALGEDRKTDNGLYPVSESRW